MGNANLVHNAAFTTTEIRRNHLAHLRHELRTPLNAVIGYSEILREDANDSGHREWQRGFQKLHKLGQQLLASVNSLLDASKTGTASLDLTKLAARLRQEMRPLAQELIEDCTRLLDAIAGQGCDGYATDLQSIRAAGGKLIAMLDAMERDPGSLSRARNAAPAVRPVRSESGAIKQASSTVLIVDDSETNRDILSRQLHREGHTVFAAQNGAMALQIMQAKKFDLVLLDVMMPEMNGIEVLDRLKADPRWRETPVIMISALDELSGVVRCLEMGAEDYLAKPFDPVLLRVRINSCLEKKRLRDRLNERLHLIQKELDIAAQIQQAILPCEFPPFPQVKEIDLFAEMIPAREVGGDFYDFFLLDEDRLGLVIGDVSGKGVPAALFMAVTRTLLKSVALTGLRPGDCLRRVNRLIALENRYFMFVTLVYGILNLRTGEFEHANAGHNPPYRLRPNGGVEPLRAAGGIVIGVNEDASYETETTRLDPGDSLFFFTDGITEAFNPEDELFSEQRLDRCLQNAGGISPEAVIKRVVDEVRQFAAGAPQSDDLTMLAVSYGFQEKEKNHEETKSTKEEQKAQ